MINFIIEIIIPVVSLLVSTYLIPWLKEKRIFDFAVSIVKAAEQVFNETGMGEEKFNYAYGMLKKKFKLSDEDIERLIEAAVFEINKNK